MSTFEPQRPKRKGQVHTFEEFEGQVYRMKWTPIRWNLECGKLKLKFGDDTRFEQTTDTRRLGSIISNAFEDLQLLKKSYHVMAFQHHHEVFTLLSHRFSTCCVPPSKSDGPSTVLFDENLIRIITDDYIGGMLHSSKPTVEFYVDLDGINLSGQRFDYGHWVDFSESTLRDCRLVSTHWDCVPFAHSDFTNTSFRDSKFFNTSFEDCKIDGCDFTKSTFKCNASFISSFMERGFDPSTEISWSNQDADKKSDELFNCILCTFGAVRSMIGCRLDWKVYNMNPDWFDSRGVIKPSKPIETPQYYRKQPINVFEDKWWGYISTPSD